MCFCLICSISLFLGAGSFWLISRFSGNFGVIVRAFLAGLKLRFVFIVEFRRCLGSI